MQINVSSLNPEALTKIPLLLTSRRGLIEYLSGDLKYVAGSMIETRRDFSGIFEWERHKQAPIAGHEIETLVDPDVLCYVGEGTKVMTTERIWTLVDKKFLFPYTVVVDDDLIEKLFTEITGDTVLYADLQTSSENLPTMIEDLHPLTVEGNEKPDMVEINMEWACRVEVPEEMRTVADVLVHAHHFRLCQKESRFKVTRDKHELTKRLRYPHYLRHLHYHLGGTTAAMELMGRLNVHLFSRLVNDGRGFTCTADVAIRNKLSEIAIGDLTNETIGKLTLMAKLTAAYESYTPLETLEDLLTDPILSFNTTELEANAKCQPAN